MENTGTSLTFGYSGLDAFILSETTGNATLAGNLTTQAGRIVKVATDADDHTFTTSEHVIVYTGTGTHVFTLPAVTGTAGTVYKAKNRGSGSITLVTTAAANELFIAAATNTTTLAVGDAVEVISDGTYWNVH
jgi:hypothetical protein